MSPFNASGNLHPSTRMLAVGMAIAVVFIMTLSLAKGGSRPSNVLLKMAMSSPFLYFGYRIGIKGTMPRLLMSLALSQAELLGDKQASRDLRKKLEE